MKETMAEVSRGAGDDNEARLLPCVMVSEAWTWQVGWRGSFGPNTWKW